MKPYDQHMSQCPKCESRSIIGPRYCVDDRPAIDGVGYLFMHTEYIRWYCDRCGYEERTRCRDAKPEGQGEGQ